jgi:hypothetical protein
MTGYPNGEREEAEVGQDGMNMKKLKKLDYLYYEVKKKRKMDYSHIKL